MKNLFTSPQFYSLKKSTHILRHTYHLFQRRKKKLLSSQSEQMAKALHALQIEILAKNKEKASDLAQQVETLAENHLKKTTLEKFRDSVLALAFALCAAIIIRQVWFEFFEIPTGSMRPTLKEKDRLVVSKTAFGINIPLTTEHVLFDPELVQRNGIFIFTGENMDIRDVDTTYFYLFPGKKQYIKRLIGKPGDTLYFYGGEIYGIDADGQDISHLLQIPQLEKIEHIPFINFKGKVLTPQQPVNGIYTPVTFVQMNEPIARLHLNKQNQITGEMLPVCATPSSCSTPLSEYSDLWGIKNFAMARLLTKEQVRQLYDNNYLSSLPDGDLYLELKHHPSLKTSKVGRDERGRLRPILGISASLIPLNEEHLHAIFKNLYTARFIVKNGFAYRYGMNPSLQPGHNSFLPHLPDVPDGTYEFYYGKAYQVLWQGITKELPSSHPLYRFNPERVQLFYNLGIEFDTRFSPYSKYQELMPSRYGYYRNGDLCLLGSVIFPKDDPILENFLEREQQKLTDHSRQYPYLPFEDAGAPLNEDGSLDVEFIKKYGITIPPKMYLALGDNHAMSADSRDFGFVPEDNIRGAPDLIFWPPGNRFGYPNQSSYPFMNLPRSLVWLCILLVVGIAYRVHRRKNRLPLYFDQKEISKS